MVSKWGLEVLLVYKAMARTVRG
ncbi:cytadherence-related protein ORF6 homolog [Mycoplasmoides pneumoniae]|nr:cytadherence-related protein ORF6 homolog [Mycoplasmoides pneumoniae]BAV20303.1 cytadherence-related protein ORF6 homolog [Mycoplasmoides pneumoniae]